VKKSYFPTPLQISDTAWQSLELQELLQPPPVSLHYQAQLVARQLRSRAAARTASGGQLQLLALLNDSLRLIAGKLVKRFPDPGQEVLTAFLELYPPTEVLHGAAPQTYLQDGKVPLRQQQMVCELLLLATQNDNRAAAPYRELFHDERLQQRCGYRQKLLMLDRQLQVTPPGQPDDMSLLELLAAPLRAAPDSLAGQLEFVRQRWGSLLPPQLLERFTSALAGAEREFHRPGGGPGLSEPGFGLSFHADGTGEHEPEAFSPDAAWMEHVVMLAKSTLVWLDQLSQRYAQPIQRLDQIPESELADLADSGVNTLWLIGLWERSSASQRLKQMRGNPEAAASAYALYDYQIAAELGGEEAFQQLRQRCRDRGIRLAGDVVPNHTGLFSRWIKEHPDRYVQLEHPPYPGYRFNGPDLSPDPELGLFIEDGYYDHSDAAVVFKHIDRRNGRERFIYHGNDGTHMPWNDTAQLDYLQAEVREAAIQTILAVARRFPVIRFDAAMTLAKKHFQRLWYPLPGEPTCVPSRHEASLSKAAFDQLFPVEFWREVVDRVAAEVPDTLLLAEAFWLMEGFFVRTLGMHRVYNSAFMNMLKREENANYRQSLKEVLEFNPEILKRFVNFMNNPDEATAVEQFGKGDKYFGVAVLLATLPGLPMFGHGQLEGLTEKYGMEYRRAYRQEAIDGGFLQHHREQIFPLLRQRRLYSGIEHFQLFEVHSGHAVNDNIYAFVNGNQDQRALIVYHNHAGEAAGRIHTSVPKRQHGEGSPATRTTLVKALNLPEAPQQLIRYRNHRSGLWHLASLDEWLTEGLLVTLDPYAYALLHDFTPLPRSSCWDRLYRKLNGAGVVNLEAELIQLYKPLPATSTSRGRLKILMVASEVAPLAKTGGLADVAGSLPQALGKLGHDVRIIMPHYPRIIPGSVKTRALDLNFSVPLGAGQRPCSVLQTQIGTVPTWLLHNPDFFDRDQLYGTPIGDYPDNAERFGFFCRAVLQALPLLEFCPDVIHLNDWQTGLIPILLRTEFADTPFFQQTGTLLTIHNLSYQGLFPTKTLEQLGLPNWLDHPDALEFWGQISYLKGGIQFSDQVNTVSPSYAREILQPQFGVGLDGVLSARGRAFSGILNGIDHDSWNPASDPALPAAYQAGNLRGKGICKKALQQELGLQQDPKAMLIAMVTRLDHQKGIDLLMQGWEDLLRRPIQFVLLGSGTQEYMDFFAARAQANPDRVAIRLDFDDALSRRIYAGSDLFLMPSHYEPCGLGQLIALRYGCVPLVRNTGGLADTITDLDSGSVKANGFRFSAATTAAMLATIDRTLKVFANRKRWLNLARSGMQADFSWQRSAIEYQTLYQQCPRA
jgi:ADP-glucose type glycogen/starch synthase